MSDQHAVPHSFCIYGAGIVATSIYTAIKTLYHKSPSFFLVSDSGKRGEMLNGSPKDIDGIVVKSLSEWKQELTMLQASSAYRLSVCDQKEKDVYSDKHNAIIPQVFLVAAPEAHHQVMVDNLLSLNTLDLFIEDSRIIPITNALENELMEAYYSTLLNCTTVSNLLSGSPIWENSPIMVREKEDADDKISLNKGTQSIVIDSSVAIIQVFQAKSHMDKPLGTLNTKCMEKRQPGEHSNDHLNRSIRHYHLPDYIHPLQAGAALTEQSVADLKDNTGDNISEKNRNYCELTATYHAWKNSHASYKGICHYRRIFDIDDKQMHTLLAMENRWDVILPYPSVYYPNIAKEHTRYVSESDWNAMLQALRETAPEYLETYEKAIVDGEQFFNNFNMLIAKAEVFDDYCNFLFSVLERTEELTTPKGWERADRFAGYLGENLTTLYFLHNREKWKIAYTGKIWLCLKPFRENST